MKFLKCLITMVISCLFCINVSAATTPNGVKVVETDNNAVQLYCEYSNGVYVLINSAFREDWGNVEPDGLPFKEVTYESLKTFYFMDEEEVFDCPKYVYGNNIQLIQGEITSTLSGVVGFSNTKEHTDKYSYLSLNVSNSSCTGKCLGDQVTLDKDYWTCEYYGPNGANERLSTGYTGEYYIYYPDDEYKYVDSKEVSSFCPDLFYNTKTKEIITIRFDMTRMFDKKGYSLDTFNKICGEEKDNFRYFCKEGNCQIPNNQNLDCEYLRDRIPEKSTLCEKTGLLKALRFLGYILYVVKVAVPLMLIIFGSIDFAKAAIESNSDATKKATTTLMWRVIAGIVIFLIPTIVNFVFSLVPTSRIDYSECRTCLFKPNSCKLK